MKSLRTPEARVRGLGSAHHGMAHWWAQRLTAVALVPLLLWFVAHLCVTTGADFAAARASLHQPVNAILTILLVLAGFHHGQLGLQVVIEDYVHTEWAKISLIILVKLLAVALGAACLFAILKVAFT
jgi:succinate dehydrogenase / fumarate reductase membrane anchor subunit